MLYFLILSEGIVFWDEEKNSSGDMNVYNTSNRILDSWTVNPGVNASYPRAMYYGWGSNSIITDRYIHDASLSCG